MDNRSWETIPADAFVEILQRVPTNPRRRLRLVCRHWRSAIDDRTPATRARDMVLAFVVGRGRPRAYVFDDLTEHRTGGRELELPPGAADRGVTMVGTCNGLLCFRRCRDDLVVVNPVTGEKLAVPPPSESRGVVSRTTVYGFAYLPETGLYKIVHVPGNGTVNLFTLGDTSWRKVPVPVWRKIVHVPSFGLASAGGVIYWVAANSHSHSVMSLDLKDERVVFVATLPVHAGLQDVSSHLTTDLHGRLVFAVVSRETKRGCRMLKGVQAKVGLKKGIQTKVWMLDDAGRSKNRPAWVLRCKVVDPEQEPPQGIALPHVTHGEHVLTTRAWAEYDRVSLHACRLSEARTHGGVVRTEGSPSIGVYEDCYSLRTFAYVETTESLRSYGGNECDIGDSDEWDWWFDGEERRWKLMPHPLWYDYIPMS